MPIQKPQQEGKEGIPEEYFLAQAPKTALHSLWMSALTGTNYPAFSPWHILSDTATIRYCSFWGDVDAVADLGAVADGGVAILERNIRVQNFQIASRIPRRIIPQGKFLESGTFFKECQQCDCGDSGTLHRQARISKIHPRPRQANRSLRLIGLREASGFSPR